MDTPSSFSDNMTIDLSGNIYIIVHHPATPKHMQVRWEAPPIHNASLHLDRGKQDKNSSMNETMYQDSDPYFFKTSSNTHISKPLVGNTYIILYYIILYYIILYYIILYYIILYYIILYYIILYYIILYYMDLRSPYLFHPGPPKNPRPLDEAVGACAGKHLEDWPEWADWPEGDVGALRGSWDGIPWTDTDWRWGHPVAIRWWSVGDVVGPLFGWFMGQVPKCPAFFYGIWNGGGGWF